jgi:CRP/FNR family transcriptional regulator
MAGCATLEKPRPIQVLRENALLGALTEDELARIAASARALRAERGQVLWFHGSEVEFFGLACDGFVKMVRSSASGTEVTLELMGPGQTFGMIGAVNGGGCPLTAIAISDLWYLRIPKHPFLEIYGGNVPLKDRLFRRTSLRFFGAVDMVARMCSDRVDERIAAVLFMLLESYGQRCDGRLFIDVPLTRQEIGGMAGTTVESTIRVISRWQKEGIVATDQHRIVICDEVRLSRLLNR